IAAAVSAARVAAPARRERAATRTEAAPAEAAAGARPRHREGGQRHHGEEPEQEGEPAGTATDFHDEGQAYQTMTRASGEVCRPLLSSSKPTARRVSMSRRWASSSKYFLIAGSAWTRRWKYSRARNR